MQHSYFVYSILVDGIVRYFGISKDPYERLKQHKRDCRRYKSLMSRRLAVAIDSGQTIELKVVEGPMSRLEADEAEIRIIAANGGCVNKGRQLWNSHKGGYGGSSEASAAVLKHKWDTDPVWRSRRSECGKRQMAKLKENPTFETKRLKAVSNAAKRPDSLRRLAKARAKIDREGQLKAMSAASKAMWADPEYKKRQLAALHAGRDAAIALKRAVQ